MFSARPALKYTSKAFYVTQHAKRCRQAVKRRWKPGFILHSTKLNLLRAANWPEPGRDRSKVVKKVTPHVQSYKKFVWTAQGFPQGFCLLPTLFLLPGAHQKQFCLCCERSRALFGVWGGPQQVGCFFNPTEAGLFFCVCAGSTFFGFSKALANKNWKISRGRFWALFQ